MKTASAFFLWGILFFAPVFSPAPAFAQTVCIDGDRLLEQARDLEKKGDMAGCAAALGRFLYFFPNDPRCGQIRYQLAQVLEKSGQTEAALAQYETLAEKAEDPALRDRAMLNAARLHEKAGRPKNAELTLSNLLTLTDDPRVRSRALYRLGWLRLESGRFNAAQTLFLQMTPKDRESHRIDRLLEEMDALGRAPRKKPETAGLLSVIPGAGYLYLGRYRDALFAFALNAGLALAAVEAFDRDMPVLGGLLTVGFAGFYSGNIYGAAAAARRDNRRMEEMRIREMKQGLMLDLSSHLDQWRVAAGWCWNF